MNGYDPHFLGLTLPLPAIRPARTADIVHSTLLRENTFADYPHYTVVTDKRRRSPAYTVLHIDQTLIKTAAGSSHWRIDTRVGEEHQLDNAYYEGANNPWDRGHMAHRESAAWGDTPRDAREASDETFYYTNATLQHENLNRDEWVALEEWVLSLDLAENNRLTVFTGPIYGEFIRTIRPTGRPQADIPSGFFKIVCFLNKNTHALDVRAFIIHQDEDALRDKQGRKLFNFQKYQVTIREIEQLTHLNFADEIYEQNPLYFYPNAAAAKRLHIASFPERIDINSPADIVDATTPRIVVADDHIEVYLAAALINPQEDETTSEWVSIHNLEPIAMDLTGWKLIDQQGRTKTLSGKLKSGETKVLKGTAGLAPVRLPNTSGLLTLFHKDGRRVDRVDYNENDLKKVTTKTRTLPLIFATYRE